MKSLYLTLTSLLLTTQVFAAVDLQKQNTKLTQVLALEQKKDYFEALLISAQSSAEILNQIQIDQIVATTESKLTEIRNEVVTSKHSEKAGFNFLFGLLTGDAQRTWDTAEIITANQSEVDSFSAKISADFRTMKTNLASYVQKNELALAYAKAFALKTAQIALKMTTEERKNLLPMVKSTIQFSQLLRFMGAQNILNCVETNYADRSQSKSLGLGGLFLSFGISEQSQQLAHQTKTCASAMNTAEIDDSMVISSRLRKLDLMISVYQKQLGLIELVETKAEPFETWGSPNYK